MMSVQTTSRPTSVTSGKAAANLYDRKVPVTPDGIVTLQVSSGAPGITVPVQVTHEQIHSFRMNIRNLTCQEMSMVLAYAKLYPPAQ
jgi:hypothetical protein